MSHREAIGILIIIALTCGLAMQTSRLQGVKVDLEGAKATLAMYEVTVLPDALQAYTVRESVTWLRTFHKMIKDGYSIGKVDVYMDMPVQEDKVLTGIDNGM